MSYKVITEGHEYQIFNYDAIMQIEERGLNYDAIMQIEERKLSGKAFQVLRFIQMLPDGTRIDGVSNEVVLEVLIERTLYLNSKFPCKENEEAIVGMQNAYHAFLRRTKDRQDRGVKGKHLE